MVHLAIYILLISIQSSILHFQRNLNKHIRKAHMAEFYTTLMEAFNPDHVFYTVEEAVKNLKSVLEKWVKTYLYTE